MKKNKPSKEYLDMSKILLSVHKDIDVGKNGMQSKNGFYIPKELTLKIFKAFHNAGYKIIDSKEQLKENGISMIIHKDSGKHGINIWNDPYVKNALCYSFWTDNEIEPLPEEESIFNGE